MNHELICTWLGLSDVIWPPDHYRLLGLEPGEADVGRIEEQVHQRLECVRRYQLTHPDLVTEAMNRLAQAFVCLTDSAAKRAYDGDLLGVAAIQERTTAVALKETRPSLAWIQNSSEDLVPIDDDSDVEEATNGAPAGRDAEDLADLPVPMLPAEAVEMPSQVSKEEPAPSVSQAQTPTTLVVPVVDPTPPDIVIPDGLPGPIVPLPPEKTDTVADAAQAAHARRGLGTKRALYYRIARTRKLLAAWEQAGKYLAQPQRRVTRPAEATELIRLLARIQSLLRGFPPMLGEAGQPGYLVVALARQAVPVPTFQTLLPSQREALAQHWEAGHKLLTAHRQFLRQEARARRKRSSLARAARTVSSFVSDYPEYVLFALAILAVTFAIARL